MRLPVGRTRTHRGAVALLLLLAPAMALAFGWLVAAGGDATSGADRRGVVAALGIGLALPLLAATITRFEMFVLGLLVARASIDHLRLGTDAVEVTELLAAMFILGGLAWLVAGSRAPSAGSRPLSRFAWLVLLSGAVAVVGSAEPATSAVEFARISSALLMLVVCERLFTGVPEARRLLVALFLSAPIPLALALHQWATGQGLVWVDEIGRVAGTFSHPNSLAMYLAFLIIMGTAVLERPRGRWSYRFLGLLLPLLWLALISTFMRGAWIATVVGVGVVAWQRDRRAVYAFVAVLTALAVLVPSISMRFSDLATTTQESGDAGNSLMWRVEHWGESLSLSEDQRLTGVGPRMIQELSHDGKAAHNDFVRTYVETGVLGLVAYLLFLWALWRRAREALHRSDTGLARGIAVGFVGLVPSFILLSLSDNLMSQGVVFWYFAAMAGCASALIDAGPAPDGASPRPFDHPRQQLEA